MPADLVTRLLLQNNQFDRSLEESKGKVDKFCSKVDKSKTSVNGFATKIGNVGVSSLTKFAGGIGLAISAGEGLEKMMRSNQTTSDLFDNNLNAAKGSVDAFFRSLTTGDWTAFQDGLINAYGKLKDLSSMLDELADKKLSLGYIKAEDLKDIEKFEQIAKDTTKSLEARLDAAQNMQGVVNQLSKKTRETAEFQLKTINKDYASRSGLNISFSDLDYFAKNTNFEGGLTNQANQVYKEFVRLNNEAERLKKSAIYDVTTYGFDPSRQAQKDYNDLRKAAGLYKEQNDFLIKQGWLTEEVDEKRSALIKTLIEQLNTEKEIYSLQKRADKTSRGVHTQGKAEQDKAASDKAVKDKREFAFTESSQHVAESIRAEFAKIMKEEVTIPVILKPAYVESDELPDITGSIEDYQAKIQETTLSYNQATSDGLRALYAQQLADLEKHLKEMTDTNQGMLDISQEVNNLLQSSVTLAFESIGDAIASDDAGEAMRNMLMGIMDLLRQFGEALIAAGMAKIAFDKLMSKPLLAIAAGGALVIATTVAKAALQKSVSAGSYAEGGVVPYRFTVGDRMTANVNGGEMILNTAKQKKLFDLLDVGRSQLGNDNVHITGRLVGDGRTLTAVLDEYAKKQRRGI